MSRENPYQPPETISSINKDYKGEGLDRLRQIASAQRHVNIVVLLYLSLLPFNVVLSSMRELGELAPFGVLASLSVVLLLLALSVLVLGVISVYRLAVIFKGPSMAVLYVLGFMVPLLGLLLLFSISGKATKELRENGIKVGLLGANPNTIGIAGE